MLTILLTSSRVAPGLLSWQAWAALREASRVLAGSGGHPQVPALTEAGVVPQIVDEPSDAAGLARMLVSAVAAGGPVAWLAPAGAQADPELLTALAELAPAGGDVDCAAVQVLHGSHDLPGAHLIDVVATMDTLRVSCPWDRKQTHSSLAPHLLEEPYEALEALENGDAAALREELGDVLLQVAFHARIAAERSRDDGGYTIDDIADTLVAKLVRRHPHVFGEVAVSSADDVILNWDEIKKAERAASSAGAAASVLDGVPYGQAALSLAAQVLRRAARAGYPVDTLIPGTRTLILEGTVPEGAVPEGAAPEGAAPELLGEELLRLAARARQAGIDPELELRAAVRRLAASVRDWELRRD